MPGKPLIFMYRAVLSPLNGRHDPGPAIVDGNLRVLALLLALHLGKISPDMKVDTFVLEASDALQPFQDRMPWPPTFEPLDAARSCPICGVVNGVTAHVGYPFNVLIGMEHSGGFTPYAAVEHGEWTRSGLATLDKVAIAKRHLGDIFAALADFLTRDIPISE